MKRIVWEFLEPQISHYALEQVVEDLPDHRMMAMQFGMIFVFPGEEEQLWFMAPTGGFKIPSEECAFQLEELLVKRICEGAHSYFAIDPANGKWYVMDCDRGNHLLVWENETWKCLHVFSDISIWSIQVYDGEVFIRTNSLDTDVWTWKIGGQAAHRKVGKIRQYSELRFWKGQLFDAKSYRRLWPVDSLNSARLDIAAYQLKPSGQAGLLLAQKLHRESNTLTVLVCDSQRNCMFPVESDKPLCASVWRSYPSGIDKRGRLHHIYAILRHIFAPVYQHGAEITRARPILSVE